MGVTAGRICSAGVAGSVVGFSHVGGSESIENSAKWRLNLWSGQGFAVKET